MMLKDSPNSPCFSCGRTSASWYMWTCHSTSRAISPLSPSSRCTTSPAVASFTPRSSGPTPTAPGGTAMRWPREPRPTLGASFPSSRKGLLPMGSCRLCDRQSD
ncbi:hypothetical protein JZ751_003181 [Albula glossodonta]|uniref:Uncharacterized protein n=1 Tax=Albula glossodonta TaxID=121402 RepID=A0A8T2N8V5_9TELE|nr:hypothetical protein JZ751_003181 [Albula glossodonta]